MSIPDPYVVIKYLDNFLIIYTHLVVSYEKDYNRELLKYKCFNFKGVCCPFERAWTLSNIISLTLKIIKKSWLENYNLHCSLFIGLTLVYTLSHSNILYTTTRIQKLGRYNLKIVYCNSYYILLIEKNKVWNNKYETKTTFIENYFTGAEQGSSIN